MSSFQVVKRAIALLAIFVSDSTGFFMSRAGRGKDIRAERGQKLGLAGDRN